MVTCIVHAQPGISQVHSPLLALVRLAGVRHSLDQAFACCRPFRAGRCWASCHVPWVSPSRRTRQRNDPASELSAGQEQCDSIALPTIPFRIVQKASVVKLIKLQKVILKHSIIIIHPGVRQAAVRSASRTPSPAWGLPAERGRAG